MECPSLHSSSRRSLVISPPVQTCTASSPVSPVTSPTSPYALSATSESESVSAKGEELTSEAGGEDSCESEESLKDEEVDEEQSETSSSEEEGDEDEEEPLPACNGPTPTPASPAAEVKSQEEAALCSPAPSLGKGQTGKEHPSAGVAVLRPRASSQGAEQSKRAASIQRSSAPPSRPPPPKASGCGSCSSPGSAEGSQPCIPRASPDTSSNPEPPETREKEGASSSGPEEPCASSTKSTTQASGGLVGPFLLC